MFLRAKGVTKQSVSMTTIFTQPMESPKQVNNCKN